MLGNQNELPECTLSKSKKKRAYGDVRQESWIASPRLNMERQQPSSYNQCTQTQNATEVHQEAAEAEKQSLKLGACSLLNERPVKKEKLQVNAMGGGGRDCR